MSSSKPTTQIPQRKPSPAPQTSRPTLASIVTGDLVQPSKDPSTGLAIFPRLPELEESTAATKPASTENKDTPSYESAFTDDPTAALPREPERPRSFSNRFISLFSPTSSTTSPVQAESQDPAKQPVQRRNPLSGGHVYCRHTWDDDCKCLNILTLDQGDYCASCWAGGCRGSRPFGARAGPS